VLSVVPTSLIGNIPTENSALLDALASQPLASEDNEHRASSHASDAENRFAQCHPQMLDSVRKNAQTWPLERIAHNVKSAGNLCDLCAMSIAHVLVALRIRPNEKSIQFKDFIDGRNAPILCQHLALYVAGRESIDTILTIPSLKQLFGSVFHAIENCTVASEDSLKELLPKSAQRFRYDSKADSDDRLGSKHPTVKPLDLMQYLVRLITPPKGTCLDPFAGTGTTGEAAWREGMSAVLIEAEAEYCADIRRRMALVLAGPDERARESIKAKNLPIDYGPLFSGIPEAETL
jgi:hypothetical protein